MTRLCLNELRRHARQRKVFITPRGRGASRAEGEGEDDYLDNVADSRLESPQESLEREELAEVLRGAIDKLPGNQRAALLMLRFHDASYEEIAASLGVSRKAVKSMLNRARESLWKTLSTYREGKWKLGRMVKGKSEKG